MPLDIPIISYTVLQATGLNYIKAVYLFLESNPDRSDEVVHDNPAGHNKLHARAVLYGRVVTTSLSSLLFRYVFHSSMSTFTTNNGNLNVDELSLYHVLFVVWDFRILYFR